MSFAWGSPQSPTQSAPSAGFPLLCPMQALVITGISLQGANLYGYILCKMGGEGDISTVAASFLSQTVFQTVSDQVPPWLPPPRCSE